MNLNDGVIQQILDAAEWMQSIAREYTTPPSPEVWDGVIRKGLERRADFLTRYTLLDVETLLNGGKLMELRPNTEVQPNLVDRPAPRIVGIAGLHDLEADNS